MTLTFHVPDCDHREFVGLPEPTRQRVQWLLTVMRAIAAVKKGRMKICEEIAAQANLHRNSIYNSWQKFCAHNGDWRALIDRRHCPEFWLRDSTKVIGLPHDFIQYWKAECESNQRAIKPARTKLLHRWHQWRAGDISKAIAGYSRCPAPAPGSQFPIGWSYSNLLAHAPADVGLAAARQGRDAALALLPGVTTTRVGSYPFAEIQFDDMWHDFEINAPRQSKSCRLLEFNCVDHFSNFIFAPGLKPRILNQSDGKRKQLDGRDFKLFWVNWLLDYGVHPQGTKFNIENGTAAISHDDEEKLKFWFRDLLTIVRSGMSGTPAFGGAHRERAKGNFRVKALKEGAGKLIHNALAGHIGQVGMHRDNLPAHHHGRSEENRALLFLQAAVPALAGKLQLGFLDLAEAVFAVNDAYNLLNDRHDHEIEGWEESGLIIDQFCASPEMGGWTSLADAATKLTDSQLAVLNLQIATNPHLKRRYKLSPKDCLTAFQSRLIKLPDAAVPDLLGKAFGEIKTVTNGLIEFFRPEFHGKLRYFASYQDDNGFRRRIDNGEQVLVHLNPWKPDHIYLTCAKTGRFLGKSQRDQAIRRGDVEAVERQFGKVQAEFKDAVAETAYRNGIDRIPGMKLNTAALRNANKPTARDRTINEANFDAASMLDDADETLSEISADPSTLFDPADLLDTP